METVASQILDRIPLRIPPPFSKILDALFFIPYFPVRSASRCTRKGIQSPDSREVGRRIAGDEEGSRVDLIVALAVTRAIHPAPRGRTPETRRAAAPELVACRFRLHRGGGSLAEKVATPELAAPPFACIVGVAASPRRQPRRARRAFVLPASTQSAPQKRREAAPSSPRRRFACTEWIDPLRGRGDIFSGAAANFTVWQDQVQHGMEKKNFSSNLKLGKFRTLLKNLNKDQKDLVKACGFGSILDFDCSEAPRSVSFWLAKRFDVHSSTVNLQNRSSFVLNPFTVHQILGIPLAGRKIPTRASKSVKDVIGDATGTATVAPTVDHLFSLLNSELT